MDQDFLKTDQNVLHTSECSTYKRGDPLCTEPKTSRSFTTSVSSKGPYSESEVLHYTNSSNGSDPQTGCMGFKLSFSFFTVRSCSLRFHVIEYTVLEYKVNSNNNYFFMNHKCHPVYIWDLFATPSVGITLCRRLPRFRSPPSTDRVSIDTVYDPLDCFIQPSSTETGPQSSEVYPPLGIGL